MTVLSACQEAAIELNQGDISSVFSSTDTFPKELRLQANRTAVAIMKYYDWRRLTVLGTLTGDGVTTQFDLPSDYDRMPKKQNVHSKSWQTASFRSAPDLDRWLYYKDTGISGTPGNWTILGGKFQIFPAMSAAETARFYYISKNVVSGNKSAFTADTDTFLLSERLLALGIVWRWRSMKRQEYAEDLQNFEIALSEEIGADKGARALTVGRQRIGADVDFAYPGVIVP
jgi:hypothetical protein